MHIILRFYFFSNQGPNKCMYMFKVSGDTPAILDGFGSKLALKRSSGETYDAHGHIKISQIIYMLGIGLSLDAY